MVTVPRLGLYAPAWFAVPTASDPYLRSAAPRVSHLHGLGQPYSTDAQNMAEQGYSRDEITQVFSAYQSGALSDAGYAQVASGNVDPSVLQDFLATDPGASPQPVATVTPGRVAPVSAPASGALQINPHLLWFGAALMIGVFFLGGTVEPQRRYRRRRRGKVQEEISKLKKKLKDLED